MKQLLGMKKLLTSKNKPLSTNNHIGSEVKCGHLLLLQNRGHKTIRVPVFVKVYRNSFEHYAVIYKDQKFSNISTYVNLKNCVVMQNDNCQNQLRVVANNMEGTVIVFETQETSSVCSWKRAFEDVVDSPPRKSISPSHSPVIPRALVLATLQEEEE